MKVAVAFDHRGVKLRERVLEEWRLWATSRRSRHRHGRGADRLSGQGARARRGDPRRPRRARRPRLRLGRRARRSPPASCRDPRRDLPRHLLRAPGRRARRHERALPRLGGRRRRARRPSSCARSSAATFDGGERYVRRLEKVERTGKGRPWLSRDCTSSRSRDSRVWIDSLSREWLQNGFLEQLMREDAVVGVTSNPTIFQKALAERRLVRRAAAGGAGARRTTRRRSSTALAVRGHPGRLRRPAARSGTTGAGRTATSRWRSTRRSRTTATGRSRRRCACTSGSTGRTSSSRSPRRSRASARSRSASRRGSSINVTLIFSLERYAAVAEAYLRGLERLVESGGDPSRVALGRVASSSPASTPRPTSGSTRSARPELKGKLAIANAKLAYQRYQELFSGPRWERARSEGRDDAALPLGVDVDEEPGLPRRACTSRS